jgi:putative ABC transport system substrate-binding protein
VNRRELLIVSAGAAAWPLTARTQQRAMPMIGFLSIGSAGPFAANVAAFKQGLSETGYVEGQNVVCEYRWAEGRYERLPALAADLVGRRVDVIATSGGAHVAQAAKSITSTIPIVFIGGDPVGEGLVASLARPGGNLTGVTVFGAELMPKRLELLSDLIPQVRVTALLVNPVSAGVDQMVRGMLDAASTKGIQVQILRASTEGEIEAAFGSIVRLQVAALIVSNDPFFFIRSKQLVALAASHMVPAIYEFREFAVDGGLLSYGTSLVDMYRRAGSYAGRVLGGVKPADLPVQQPTKFELVINLKTAKALGLTVPEALLARADEVIE